MQPLYGISRHNRSRSEQWQTVYWSKPSDLHIPASWHNGDDINQPACKPRQSAPRWHDDKNSNAHCAAFKTRWLHHQTLLESWCQDSLCKTSLFPTGEKYMLVSCCLCLQIVHLNKHTCYKVLCILCSGLCVFPDKTPFGNNKVDHLSASNSLTTLSNLNLQSNLMY